MKYYLLLVFVSLLPTSCKELKIRGDFEIKKNEISLILENATNEDLYLIGDPISYCLPDSIYNKLTLDDFQCLEYNIKNVVGYSNQMNIDTLENRYLKVLAKEGLVTLMTRQSELDKRLFKMAMFIFIPAKQRYTITYGIRTPLPSQQYVLHYDDTSDEDYKKKVYSLGNIGSFKPYKGKVAFE